MFGTSLRLRRSDIRTIILLLVVGFVTGVFMMIGRPQRGDDYFSDKLHAYDEVLGDKDDENIPDKIPSHDLNEIHHLGEGAEAERIKNEIKVLCMVNTIPKTHDTKAKHVKATWGKRCNKLIFLSSENDEALGAVRIELKEESRKYLWMKIRAGFKYVYEHYLNDYDWFYKCDDDTYAIMENMRYMLSPYDPSHPVYLGSRFKMFTSQGYMSGGGGYILSREAVKQLVETAIPNNKVCLDHPPGPEDSKLGYPVGSSDVNMGVCLNNIGILAGDSRDSLGRGRMFPFDPDTHLMGNVDKWYLDYVYYKPDTGINCCSDVPVSFHYMNAGKMYQMEYLLYHARPYGITHRDPYPAPFPLDKRAIPKEVLEKQNVVVSADNEKQQLHEQDKKTDIPKQEEKQDVPKQEEKQDVPKQEEKQDVQEKKEGEGH